MAAGARPVIEITPAKFLPITPFASPWLEASSLIYLAAILLILGLIVNIVAQIIVRRFDPMRGAAR